MLPHPPADYSPAAILESFASQQGLDLDAMVSIGLHAMARQILATGTLTLPLQIGMPSPQCQLCPFAQARHDLPANVRRGPW